MESRGGQKSFLVDVELDGGSLQMEIDTGVALFVVSEATFRRKWPEKSLESTVTRLRMYTGELVPALGSITVCVQHGTNEGELPLFVVKGDGPSLLGRNWLQSLQLDWNVIHRMTDSPLKEVLGKLVEVFKNKHHYCSTAMRTVHLTTNSICNTMQPYLSKVSYPTKDITHSRSKER